MKQTNHKIIVLTLLIVFSLVIISAAKGTGNDSVDLFKDFNKKISTDFTPNYLINADYPSHTNIPRTNFTGTYNITLYANPDNADEVIFRYLNAAKTSIYVSMYTISRPDFTNTLIELKKANAGMDIQVLISYRRVGSTENADTEAAAQSLEDNNIPVYTSTQDDDKVDGFYHAKYWIIDDKHVFVYSGNWSPRSVTPQLPPDDPSYTSSEANRDMGVAVHDASDIASFFKQEVWDKDVAEANDWTPTAVKMMPKTRLSSKPSSKISSPLLYYPTFEAENFEEEMTLSPMFTPDNALDFYKWWIDRANSTIFIQAQYITQFDDDVSWNNDPSPLVRSLIKAKNRDIDIHIQVNEDSDSDNATAYFLGKGIEVRWMGNSQSSTDGWLSDTHNKLVIIDNKTTLLSSINFGKNAFTNNREAGMVIQSTTVADYYASIFKSDWADGEIPPYSQYTDASTSEESTGLFGTPFSWTAMLIVLILLPIFRRKTR